MIPTGRPKLRQAFLAGLMLLTLAGCGTSEPSRLYTLSGLPFTAASIQPASTSTLAIGIGPVTLPLYLDRPQIVRRTSPNRLEIAEFDRWAEPLSNTVPRILAENIGLLLLSEKVYVLPRRRRLPLDLTVEVDISRFEPMSDGTAVLAASWHIFAQSDAPVGNGSTEIRIEGANPENFETRVKLLSDALGQLSGSIAESILDVEI
jgi:uncharacterized lipoprotein YmbA